MHLRKLLIGLAAAAIVAPMFGSVGAHDKLAACNGVVTAHDVGGQIIYNDDRGPDEANPVDGIASGGWWIYLEDNGHEGLQSGGDHAAIGETPVFSDTCVNVEGEHADLPKDSILF